MTTAEAQAIVAALGLSGAQAQMILALATPSTTTGGTCYQFTTTLAVGSRGDAVSALQGALNVTPRSGYFGGITKAAVMSFQASHGLSQVGQVGPATRAALNAMCTTTNNGNGNGNNGNNNGNTTPGAVNAMLSVDNPASGSIVSGQATADLAHFTFTGSGTITSMTLQRIGVSSNTTFNNVYLYDGVTRLSDGATVSNNGTISFNGLSIAVSGSKTIAVKADVASNATSGQTFGVTLTGFTANGSAKTALLSGNLMGITSGTGLIATVVVGCNTAAGSGSTTCTAGTTSTVNAGTTGYTLWSAPVTVSTHTVWLKSLTLKYIGSAPIDAFSNLRLYVNGLAVGNVGMVNSMNNLTFDLSGAPVLLNTGTATLEVRGDVMKGSARTIQLSLQNAADLMVTDSQLNVNVSSIGPTSSATTFAINNGGTVTISQGSLTAVIDPSFTTMTNVTGGSSNAVIGRYKLTAYGEDEKVTSVSVTPALSGMSPSAAGLTNVSLYSSCGSTGLGQVGSTTATWTSGAIAFTTGSSLIVPAGSSCTLEVRADIMTTGSVAYTAGTITVSGTIAAGNVQGMSSLQTNTSAVTLGATSGLAVQTGTLSVAKSTAYANQTFNPNMTNQKIASYTLNNRSSSESVRVTNLALTMTPTTTTLTNFSNVKTSESTGSGAVPQAAGTTLNYSVDFTLAPGATKTVDVFADLGTDSSGSIVTTLLPTAYGSSSNVVLTPSAAVTGQTITLSTGSFGTPALVTSSSNTAQYVAAAGGATNATKATYTFTASNGTATIGELKFSVVGSGVASITVDGITAPVNTPPATTLTTALTDTTGTAVVVGSTADMTVGTIITIDTEQMLVTAINSSTSITVTRGANSSSAATHSGAAAVTLAGLADVNGLSINVPNGLSGVNKDVFVTYSPVGAGGTASNTTAAVELTFVKRTLGGTTTSAAITPIAAPTMNLVGSKPIVTMIDSNDVLVNGQVKLASVKVAADAKGDIKLTTLPLSVTTTGNVLITTGTLVVKNAATGAVVATTDNTLVTTTTGATDTVTITFTGDYLITAGDANAVTFDIYNDVSGVTGGPAANAIATKLGSSSSFTWKDTAGNSSSAIDGSKIFNYPTNSSVVND